MEYLHCLQCVNINHMRGSIPLGLSQPDVYCVHPVPAANAHLEFLNCVAVPTEYHRQHYLLEANTRRVSSRLLHLISWTLAHCPQHLIHIWNACVPSPASRTHLEPLHIVPASWMCLEPLHTIPSILNVFGMLIHHPQCLGCIWNAYTPHQENQNLLCRSRFTFVDPVDPVVVSHNYCVLQLC